MHMLTFVLAFLQTVGGVPNGVNHESYQNTGVRLTNRSVYVLKILLLKMMAAESCAVLNLK